MSIRMVSANKLSIGLMSSLADVNFQGGGCPLGHASADACVSALFPTPGLVDVERGGQSLRSSLRRALGGTCFLLRRIDGARRSAKAA